MTAVLRAFSSLMAQIRREAMLAAVLVLPVPVALLLRLGMPRAEAYFTPWLGPGWLSTHFPLGDLLIALLPAVMLSYAVIMAILDEADMGITRYLAVTPVTRRGYLLSRLACPAAVSALYGGLLLAVFSLTPLTPAQLVLLPIMAAVLGAQMALVVLSLSANKVEGLALVKLSSGLVLGIFVPSLIPGGIQYVLSPLPSFWMSKLITGGTVLPALLFSATAALWLWPLYRRFTRKIL